MGRWVAAIFIHFVDFIFVLSIIGLIFYFGSLNYHYMPFSMILISIIGAFIGLILTFGLIYTIIEIYNAARNSQAELQRIRQILEAGGAAPTPKA